MKVSLIRSLTAGTLYISSPPSDDGEGLQVEELEFKNFEASDVVVLTRDPNSPLGDYVVALKVTSGDSLKFPIGAHVRIHERLEDPLLNEDEDTRQILSRLFGGRDLRDDKDNNQKEKVAQGKLVVKDPRNISRMIDDGVASGKFSDDHGFVAEHCLSLVNEETQEGLQKLIASHNAGEHRFIDGLRRNAKLIEFISKVQAIAS